MFRFKENSRLMPCMEQVGLTAFTIVIPNENNQKAKLSLHEGTLIVTQYLEIAEEINKEKVKISSLENKQRELLEKINDNPILMNVLRDLIAETSEKDNASKIK